MSRVNYRNDFFLLVAFAEVNAQRLIYLDSAATSQTPQVVLDAVRRFEETSRANVHRGIYRLAEEATAAYEGARERVRGFLNARSTREIIFTRNTTESINLVSHSLSRGGLLKEGDRILTSIAEHHSNFLPWQALKEHGCILDVIDVDGEGKMPIENIQRAITPKTKLAAFSHVSHVLGTINPVAEWARLFRERGILFLVDAAQAAAHLPIDVKKIGCDFLAFSAHKMGGPMGIGVLYGREELLEKMPPFLRGGGMIREVSVDNASWDDIPFKFEAGTPNVSGAVGLGAAIDYIKNIGFDTISGIDEELTRLTFERLGAIPGVKIFGPKDAKERGGVVSFVVDGVHPHDLASILDEDGVAIRAGHHCAMPLMKFLGVPATSRASFWVYNEPEDVEALANGIKKAILLLK